MLQWNDVEFLVLTIWRLYHKGRILEPWKDERISDLFNVGTVCLSANWWAQRCLTWLGPACAYNLCRFYFFSFNSHLPFPVTSCFPPSNSDYLPKYKIQKSGRFHIKLISGDGKSSPAFLKKIQIGITCLLFHGGIYWPLALGKTLCHPSLSFLFLCFPSSRSHFKGGLLVLTGCSGFQAMFSLHHHHHHPSPSLLVVINPPLSGTSLFYGCRVVNFFGHIAALTAFMQVTNLTPEKFPQDSGKPLHSLGRARMFPGEFMCYPLMIHCKEFWCLTTLSSGEGVPSHWFHMREHHGFLIAPVGSDHLCLGQTSNRDFWEVEWFSWLLQLDVCYPGANSAVPIPSAKIHSQSDFCFWEQRRSPGPELQECGFYHQVSWNLWWMGSSNTCKKLSFLPISFSEQKLRNECYCKSSGFLVFSGTKQDKCTTPSPANKPFSYVTMSQKQNF